MAATVFKVGFSLDEEDARYFKSLFQKAKQAAAQEELDEVLRSAEKLVENVRGSKKVPNFVVEAVQTLEDLCQVIEDEDWAAPKKVRGQVLGALAYFSNPEDLIPDHIPVLGFLDDAIMIGIIEQEFKHELGAYRRFRRFRDGAEQRPWTGVAKERLPRRLKEQRAKLRKQVEAKQLADKKGERRFSFF